MKIAVMGTGGVGGYFGARLAAGGQEVHCIARGAHLQAIRNSGLRVLTPAGEIQTRPAQVTDDPADVGVCDLVLFGVKLWDTAAAAQAIRPLVGPHTAVVSFQNGVIKDDILRSVLGSQAVAGGVCYVAASIESPGVIRQTGAMQKLVFGEYNGASSRLERFLVACREAGIDAQLSGDIARVVWEKFVFLVAVSGSTAVTRCRIGPVRGDAGARRLLTGLMDEAIEVGRAEGIALAPGLLEERLRFVDQLLPEMTSSMHTDLERGNRLEVEWLSGDVVRRGERLGVATPVNRAVWDALSLHAGGRHG